MVCGGNERRRERVKGKLCEKYLCVSRAYPAKAHEEKVRARQQELDDLLQHRARLATHACVLSCLNEMLSKQHVLILP